MKIKVKALKGDNGAQENTFREQVRKRENTLVQQEKRKKTKSIGQNNVRDIKRGRYITNH